MFQFAAVKVSGEGKNVHCAPVAIVTETLAVGCDVKTTVNAPFEPPSVAVVMVGVTVIDATSLSATVKVWAGAVLPAYPPPAAVIVPVPHA